MRGEDMEKKRTSADLLVRMFKFFRHSEVFEFGPRENEAVEVLVRVLATFDLPKIHGVSRPESRKKYMTAISHFYGLDGLSVKTQKEIASLISVLDKKVKIWTVQEHLVLGVDNLCFLLRHFEDQHQGCTPEMRFIESAAETLLILKNAKGNLYANSDPIW